VLWLGYFGFGASQFYQGHRGWLWVKGVFAAVLTQITAMLAIGFVAYFYLGASSFRA
jgi:TM2 domain-containing membrane protein YozV